MECCILGSMVCQAIRCVDYSSRLEDCCDRSVDKHCTVSAAVTQTGKQEQYADQQQPDDALVAERVVHIRAGSGSGKI